MTLYDGKYCARTGKVAHASPTEARQTMAGMQKKKRRVRRTDRLNVYRCADCGQWHVGNKPR